MKWRCRRAHLRKGAWVNIMGRSVRAAAQGLHRGAQAYNSSQTQSSYQRRQLRYALNLIQGAICSARFSKAGFSHRTVFLLSVAEHQQWCLSHWDCRSYLVLVLSLKMPL
jgi:hypothetical protein